ncbi:MAG: hypothetical protein QME61_00985 [Patescibacteria group bacterium]|nr:hypothetical protein [Patescibacteria group bacterium]
MVEKYTREQFWKLYEKLPPELKEAVFSEEIAENIWNICERNEVDEISEVARYVGRVLMGILPPDEFQTTLEKEIKLKKEKAKKITQEINRFIFYPLRPYLEKIYKIEIAPPVKMEVAPLKEKPKRDIYREPIE